MRSVPSWQQTLKAKLYRASDAIGATARLRDSEWRTRHLLILAYHGISLQDEHEWNPALYMPADLLRQRLEALQRMNCAVLPLGEAVNRLYSDNLPPRAVALTFDDGNADFYLRAWPVLKQFGYPVTVYWTTYYSEHPQPVPSVAARYLLWRANADSPALIQRCDDPSVSAAEKDELLAQAAEQYHLNYGEFKRSRLFHIMTQDEAADLVHAGVDFQLHTHRHRTPADPDLFARELADNRRCILEVGAPRPEHFCYPSGNYSHLERDWLAEAELESAVTCDPALAGPQCDHLDLPRFVDTCYCDPQQFEAWLSGLPQLLPRRKAEQQLPTTPAADPTA